MRNIGEPSPIAFPATVPSETQLRICFNVITPVYNGGVTPGSYDNLTPIRENSIRGQLRFWWRATHGARLASIDKMWEREALLWGNTKGRGLVSLLVVSVNPEVKKEAVPRSRKGLAYGAFPLFTAPLDERFVYWLNGEIDLQATVRARPESKEYKEIRDAIRAWLLFGGVGGRTRRGFGAVELSARSSPDLGVPGQELTAAEQMCSECAQYDAKVDRIASLLKGASITTRPDRETSPLEALNRGLERLFQFRQGSPHARPDTQQHQVSYWPESQVIQNIQGRLNDLSSQDLAFPRGQFGLPIGFRFKNKSVASCELRPEVGSRWPSPLVIRPQRGGDLKTYTCIALRLAGTIGTNALLVIGQGTSKKVSIKVPPLLRDPKRKNNPLFVDGSRDADPIAAFLKFFIQTKTNRTSSPRTNRHR